MAKVSKSRSVRVAAVSAVPAPYQRELFVALAEHPAVNLDVFYQSPQSTDNPWPLPELNGYEYLLAGQEVSFGKRRVYVNWGLPNFSSYDLTIVNVSYFSPTAQWLMRSGLRDAKWVFWGERMRSQASWWRRYSQRQVVAPLGHADAIAGIGSLAVDSYKRTLSDQRVYNIPYFTELAPFFDARAPNGEDERPTILFCGQMIERKGVDLLLDAFNRLVKEGIEAQLRLVGREAKVRRLSHSLASAARERIQIMGFQDPEELPGIFASADVFALPSRHDGWGVVVNQALGAGLPIICSDEVGAGHDLVIEGENGVRVAAGESLPLYCALKHVVTNEEVRKTWGKRSRQLASDWRLEKGVSRWLRVIDSLVRAS